MLRFIRFVFIALSTIILITCSDSTDGNVASDDPICREYCEKYASFRPSVFRDEYGSMQACVNDCRAGLNQTEKETPECLPLGEDFTVCVTDMTCSEIEELADNPINNTDYPCADAENEYFMCALESMLGDLEISIDY
jgi:hypothetical protein